MAARAKERLGEHSRLSRRARHLIRLLRRTRVHTVRMAILRELQYELQHARKLTRRGRDRVMAWVQRAAARAGDRLTRHTAGRHHCIYCRRRFRTLQELKAHAASHDRENRAGPQHPGQPRDRQPGPQRTAWASARAHAHDHLVAAGLRTPDGRHTEHARTRPAGPVRGISDLRVRVKHDRNAARARRLEARAAKANRRGDHLLQARLNDRAAALRAGTPARDAEGRYVYTVGSRQVRSARKLSTRRLAALIRQQRETARARGTASAGIPRRDSSPGTAGRQAPAAPRPAASPGERGNGPQPAPAPRTVPAVIYPPRPAPSPPGTPPLPADTIRPGRPRPPHRVGRSR